MVIGSKAVQDIQPNRKICISDRHVMQGLRIRNQENQSLKVRLLLLDTFASFFNKKICHMFIVQIKYQQTSSSINIDKLANQWSHMMLKTCNSYWEKYLKKTQFHQYISVMWPKPPLLLLH